MRAGDSKPKLLVLEAADGSPLSYADKAAFILAGWALTWVDVNGSALAVQPSYVIAVADPTVGLHLVKYTQPSGVYSVVPTVPTDYAIAPAGWSNEGETYDIDALAGLMLTTQGTPALNLAVDGVLGDVVDGDSWAPVGAPLQIPLGKLTPFGVAFADLASGWTITAGLKSKPTDDTVPIDCAFDVATSGTFTPSWDDFPTDMALDGTDAQLSKLWYVDIQLVRTSDDLTITTNRYTLNVVWDRDILAGP